jgi:hypothetical protein
MPKPYQLSPFEKEELKKQAEKQAEKLKQKWSEEVGKVKIATSFYEPEHYHKHNIDTIQFLQEGFPPEVFIGFAIGSATKYLQRYPYKNGMEDLIKAKDYIERLIDFHQRKNPIK